MGGALKKLLGLLLAYAALWIAVYAIFIGLWIAIVAVQSWML